MAGARASETGAHGHHRHGRGAFTLVEVLVVFSIIGVLIVLALGAASVVARTARTTAERQFVGSLALGVERFKQEYGFLPALVDDTDPQGPVDRTTLKSPRVHRAPYLRCDRTEDWYEDRDGDGRPEDARYSVHSLPFYLVGVLDREIDGYDGPSFTAPQRDGAFSRQGTKVDAFVDVSRDRERLASTGSADEGRYTLRDRWGTAVRYYRWEPVTDASKKVVQYQVPRPAGSWKDNEKLRSAAFAIVSLGPDRATDGRKPLAGPGTDDPNGSTDASETPGPEAADDIVEVGR